MKYTISLICISLITTSSLTADYPNPRAQQKQTYSQPSSEPYCALFVEGVIAGAIATVVVDAARNQILPDATPLQLYKRFGICRDQLTGTLKSLAALCIIAFNSPWISSRRAYTRLAARLVGILAGIHGTAYLKHSLSKK